MIDALNFEFIQNAILAGVLVSIACGLVGTFVVVKRIVFISGGISHASFGGIGLGIFLGINPIFSATLFSLISALGIGMLSERANKREDSAIGILWALGMSLGVIFISLTPGYAPDLFSYLFGNILTVSTNDIYLMIVLNLIIIIAITLFYKEFLVISFDEEYAKSLGVPVRALYYLLLCLIALTVVLLIRVVGIVLVIAFLTVPAVISNQYTNSLRKMMGLSTVIGIFIVMTGLALSFKFNLASGATIVIVSIIFFAFSSLYKYFLKYFKFILTKSSTLN